MTRPTWLAPQDLEELLVEQNLQINITELRQNRNECKLTESLFAAIRQRLPEDRHTNEFELQYARILLAADVQRILIAWCEQGLKETMRVTMGKLGLPYDAVQAPEVDQAGHNGCMSSPDVFTAKYNTSGSGRILPQLCIPQKRVYHDSCSHTEERKTRKTYSPVTSTERDLRCPYHVMNPDEHRFECANRNYPNPRKLKEHIWKFTKPFKCPTCGEGFGREKTKEIHLNERKVKCREAKSTYEGSPELRRDQAIERAKNTKEMIEAFEQYKSETASSSVLNNGFILATSPTNTEDGDSSGTEFLDSPNPANDLSSNNYPGSWMSEDSTFMSPTSPDVQFDRGGGVFPLSGTAGHHSTILENRGSSDAFLCQQAHPGSLGDEYQTFHTASQPSFSPGPSCPPPSPYFNPGYDSTAIGVDQQGVQSAEFIIPQITVTEPPCIFPDLSGRGSFVQVSPAEEIRACPDARSYQWRRFKV